MFRKVLVVFQFIISIVLIMAGADAYAAGGGRAAGTVGATSMTIGTGDNNFVTNVSKNVGMQYNSAGGSLYAAGAVHIGGSRHYATNSSTPSIKKVFSF